MAAESAPPGHHHRSPLWPPLTSWAQLSPPRPQHPRFPGGCNLYAEVGARLLPSSLPPSSLTFFCTSGPLVFILFIIYLCLCLACVCACGAGVQLARALCLPFLPRGWPPASGSRPCLSIRLSVRPCVCLGENPQGLSSPQSPQSSVRAHRASLSRCCLLGTRTPLHGAGLWAQGLLGVGSAAARAGTQQAERGFLSPPRAGNAKSVSVMTWRRADGSGRWVVSHFRSLTLTWDINPKMAVGFSGDNPVCPAGPGCSCLVQEPSPARLWLWLGSGHW